MTLHSESRSIGTYRVDEARPGKRVNALVRFMKGQHKIGLYPNKDER